MSGDLWDQMMAQEKHRVTELEQKYSDLMKARGVYVHHILIMNRVVNCNVY